MHFQIKGLFWDGFDYFNIHNNPVSNDCFYDMSCIHESMQPSYLHKCVPTLSKLFHWHDDVMKWKHFPCSWPFVWGIHRSPVIFPHKGLWRGAMMFSLICVWINGWVNNRKAGDLRCYRAHYDVTLIGNGVIVWLSQGKKSSYSGYGRWIDTKTQQKHKLERCNYMCPCIWASMNNIIRLNEPMN